MGYGIAPDMTTGEYMCLTPCEHRDCAANRADWIENANCKICGKPVKPGDKFYYNEQGKTDKVHFLCEVETVNDIGGLSTCGCQSREGKASGN